MKPHLLLCPILLAACAQAPVLTEPIQAPVRDIIQADATLRSLAIAPDGRHIARLAQDGEVVLFDMLLGKEVGRIRAEDFPVTHMSLGRDRRVALAGPRGVRVEHPQQGTTGTLPAAGGEVDFVVLQDSGTHILLAVGGDSVRVYRREDGQLIRSVAAPDATPGWRVRQGPGFGVSWVHEDGRVHIQDALDPAAERRLQLPAGSGRRLRVAAQACVFLGEQLEVHTRSLADGVRLHRPFRLPAQPQAMALSPDASVLAAEFGAGHVVLFDLARQQELLRFQSAAWPEGGLAFSGDGHFLAWIEPGRKSMRYWAPGQGVVQWTDRGAELRPEAQGVCTDLATVLRFGEATPLVKRARRLLDERSLDAALAAAEEAGKVLDGYPGLAAIQAEVEERLFAFNLHARLKAIQAGGDYRQAATLLRVAVKERSKFDDYGFAERLAVLDEMLQHFDAAEAARRAGQKSDAILAFRAAVAIVPDLLLQHPHYQEMEAQVLEMLRLQVQVAQGEQDHSALLDCLAQIRRLRPLNDAELLLLGRTHQHLGQLDEARKSLAAVAQAAPEYEAARFTLARLARAGGDLEGARAELELARQVAPGRSRLEREYAEVCQQLGDVDTAVTAWAMVGQLEAENPEPMEKIAELEASRRQWQRATLALRSAIQRDKQPRPRLLTELARMFKQAGTPEKVLATYLELIALVQAHPEAGGFLGEQPRQRIENWIRNLGYVRGGEGWIRREQFLIAQGWVKVDGVWLRPEEEQLHGVAGRYQTTGAEELRAFSDARYQNFVAEQRVSKGMTRREVLQSWGFFADINRLQREGVEFQQLIYGRSRKVYLRDGLVCFWTE